jgi:hypothetical protein
MHLKRTFAAGALFHASFGLMMVTTSVQAQERVSPDKQWEYEYSNGVGPQIVKTGTSEVVLDLSDALPCDKNGAAATQEAEPVWAPDSKRVAFNYVVSESHSSGFGTTVLFELRNDKWVFLRSPIDSKDVQQAPEPGPGDNRDQLARLAKRYLPKKSYSHAILKASMTGDFLKVARWTNPDTAVFWAFSADVEVGAQFELKVNPEGNWRLLKTKVLFGKAAEKEQGW